METEFPFETFVSAHRTDSKGRGMTFRLRQNHKSDVCCYCGVKRQSAVSMGNRRFGDSLYLLTYLVILTYLLTYLLTPWSRVLLEKLIDLQLVKKFPAFYGTRRFITALTSARHLSLS